MGFKITKDNVHNTEEYKKWDCVGKTFYCVCECCEDSPTEYKEGKHKFRLLDDDGEIYYYGVSDDNSCFCPLDWAEPLWGCTEIQYRNEKTKEYETL
jgi:hypothetical protein